MGTSNLSTASQAEFSSGTRAAIGSRLEENRVAWKACRKVAWLRSGALGDLVVGLASLAEMARFFPAAKVTVIGPALWTELLSPEAMPFLERIIVVARKSTQGRAFKNVDGQWVAESDGESEQELAQLLRGYDALVNTNTDSYRYGFQAMRAGVPLRIGSAPLEMAWLYHYNAPFVGKDPLIHERDWPLLVMEFATPGWRKFTRTTRGNRQALESMLRASQLVREWREQGLPAVRRFSAERLQDLIGLAKHKYILVNPTSSRREKAWPAEKVRELLLGLREELRAQGLEARVIGAPSETSWLQEVAGGEFRIIQPRNLGELQEIVHGARLLLTNVSSMQFIAATTGTPTLTVVGRSNPVIWGPVGFHDRVVCAAPLAALSGDIFIEEAAMYSSISVEEVRRALLTMIR